MVSELAFPIQGEIIAGNEQINPTLSASGQL